MQLELAQKIADRLLKRLDPSGQSLVVGSVRRRKPEPRDIELLLPHEPAARDAIYHRLAPLVATPNLFHKDDPPSQDGERPFFEAVKGLAPGFRYAQLLCRASQDERWRGQVEDFKVDLFRFVKGPPDNYGWLALMRTGPAEFSRACLIHFKRTRGGGSRDGFLVDANGEPIPTPTELSAFQALGIDWVEPERRAGPRSVRPRRDWYEPIPAQEIPF